MAISAMILPEFDQEVAITRTFLERVPDDKFSWQPHEKSMTLGRLATHVAEVPGWAKETMTLTELNLAPPGGPAMQPWTPSSRAEILTQFEKNIAAARKAIADSTDDAYAVPWSLLLGEQTIFTMPRAAVLRGMVMNHMVHHRAQLGVYLRLLDIPVPKTYGPSADEP
jgi:uncharacterized damage-inducible protein DinB